MPTRAIPIQPNGEHSRYAAGGDELGSSMDDLTGDALPTIGEDIDLDVHSRVIVVTHHLPVVCQLTATSKLPPARAEREREREKEKERYFASNYNYSTSKYEYGHQQNLKSGTSVVNRNVPKSSSSQPDSAHFSAGNTFPVNPQLSRTSELNGHLMVPNSPLGKSSALRESVSESPPGPSASKVKSTSRSESIDWTFSERRGHSALYSGIKSVTSKAEMIHIGWTGSTLDDDGDPIDSQDLSDEFMTSLREVLYEKQKSVPVFLDDKVATAHYEGYCKAELWPLFHYVLWDSASASQLDEKNWFAYQAVNQKFAEAIAETYRPGDLIWINDYHLLLVPSLLRKLVPNAIIGVFLHTPFPTSELFRCLPKRDEILEGVLGANLVGFQTYSYSRHFISTCTRVLNLDSSPKGVDHHGSLVQVAIFPVGIDIEGVLTQRQTPAVQEKIATIRDLYAGKKIIIGRDKLDHIKGVQHKLNAFEKFLEMYPEWQNNVVLIQVSTPAQRVDPRLETRVSELVSRINGTYGSLEFTPVHHYHQHLALDEYYALLSVADVGLITSLRDGMNTTSHEFIVCQDENKGPLILSEFTGTAGSLSASILVNPWDYVGVANAINEALIMPKEEKYQKHQQQFAHVSKHTASFWATSFMRELVLVSRSPSLLNTTPVLDFDLGVDTYRKATKRLLMFDYDGTLTPIVKIPSGALPPPKMLKALSTLVADPANYVFIISGRDQQTLEEWLGHIPGLGLSAEHGSFIKWPETGKWINLTEDMDFSWKQEVAEIFNYYTERTQGSFVEHKRCAITWHYRLADPEYGLFQARECRNHLENAILSKKPVEILVGKKNLEVRPHSINKGEIVKKLVSNSSSSLSFVFCAGDDRTDEDMFAGLKQCGLDPSVYFNCTLGPPAKKTQASWHVSAPEEIIEFMTRIAEVSREIAGVE